MTAASQIVIVCAKPGSRDAQTSTEWLEEVINANLVQEKKGRRENNVAITHWSLQDLNDFLNGPPPPPQLSRDPKGQLEVVILVGPEAQALYTHVGSSGTNFDRVRLLKSVHSVPVASNGDWKFKQTQQWLENMIGNSVRNLFH
jgi:hypothetical protein